MDDQRTDREGGGSKLRSLDKISCILLVPVVANLSMWTALVAYPQLDRNEWFLNEVFGRILVIGFASSIIGIIYTAYISAWRGRDTSEVAACCLLSAITLVANLIGFLAMAGGASKL
jgi:hypothetical protein